MKIQKYKAKVIDRNIIVTGFYFKTPLTDENSGTEPDAGWHFLSDGEIRHCLSDEFGVAYVIDPDTLEAV